MVILLGRYVVIRHYFHLLQPCLKQPHPEVWRHKK